MIVSPWNSTVLRQHKNIAAIVSELAIAKAMGGLIAESESVMMVTPMAEKVDAFVMPITSCEYADRRLSDSGVVFMDGRSFMRRENRADAGFVVVNQMQSDFFCRIGDLTALWIKQPALREDFLRTGDLAAQVYISWVSHSIASKLGLDLEVSRELQIITGVYYIHQFFDAGEVLSSEGKAKVMRLIQRWTRHPLQIIEGIVEQLPYMNLLEDYVKGVQGYFAHNTRVSQINAGFLVMSLGRSWFGYGAPEIAAVSLEYPPAFLALVEAACNAKVWRKTHLGKLVERLNTGRAADEFIRSMEMLAGKAKGKTR